MALRNVATVDSNRRSNGNGILLSTSNNNINSGTYKYASNNNLSDTTNNNKEATRKSSYYVWFLGSRRSKGLRGDSAIRVPLRLLLTRERQNEPLKVTLQVSNKGVKMIHNSFHKPPSSSSPSAFIPGTGNGVESLKNFIPPEAITYVSQEDPPDDDVIVCVLLQYHPEIRCPIHVHAFRCDSPETAALLRRQLTALVDRPEQQRRLRDLENRLAATTGITAITGNNVSISNNSESSSGLGRCLSSEGRGSGSARGDTDSSGGSDPGDSNGAVVDERTANLYASLAAELREKLGSRERVPILLPPRDYDTVHRNQGKLMNIEARRSMQVNVVGKNALYPRGGKAWLRYGETPISTITPKHHNNNGIGPSPREDSSGVGSDEPPPGSPPRGTTTSATTRKTSHISTAAPASSSDEEWEAQRQLQIKAAHQYLRWEARSPPPAPPTSHYPQPLPYKNDKPSPPQWTSSLPRDHGYPRVLPRVLPRVPSMHHHVNQSTHDLTAARKYQELPEEKRYPGLDRDSARMNYLKPSSQSQSTQDLRRRSYLEPPSTLVADERRFSYADPRFAGRRRTTNASAQNY